MIRSAIIGYGGMGSWHHDSITEKVPGIQVVGAYDVRPEALEKAASKGLHTYQTLEELLADTSLDLVTVATPNNFHKDLVIRCLESGKNVVCEKPVAMNAAELTEMIAASERTGRLFSVHQNRRWDKDYAIIKKLVQENTLGKPYFIESRVQGSSGGMHGWRGHKINGGGMLYDWGVHLLDQLMDMIDSPVVSVTAQLQSLFSDEIDDNVKLLLQFENGVSALCTMETNCFIPLPWWWKAGRRKARSCSWRRAARWSGLTRSSTPKRAPPAPWRPARSTPPSIRRCRRYILTGRIITTTLWRCWITAPS